MRLLLLLLVCDLAVRVCCEKCRTRQCRKQGQYLRQSLKLTADPCKDFYSFACGNFANHHQVPDATLGWGLFEMADNQTTYSLKAILEEPSQASDPEALKKAKRMYSGCLDTKTRNDKGLVPLLRVIMRAGGWPMISSYWRGSVTWHKVAKLTARYGIPLFFNLDIKQSSGNYTERMIVLDAPMMRLQMPARRRKLAVDLLALPHIKYNMLRYLVNVVTEILGVTSASVELQLEEVLGLARKLQLSGNLSLPVCDSEVTVRQLSSKYKDIDWLDFLRTCFQYSGVTVLPDDIVHVSNWSRLDNILQVFKSATPRLRANYIVSRLVMYLAPETTQRMRQHLIQLYRDLDIIPANYNNWQYCINKVQDFPEFGLSGVLAHKFMKHHFRRGNVRRAHRLVNDVRKASEKLLEESDWMDTYTMQLVKLKSQEMTVNLGFPPWMTNITELNNFYSQLKIRKCDHFGNVLRLRRFMQAKKMATLSDGNRLKTMWSVSPFVVNAFYETQLNSVTLPGVGMQFPFYSGQHRFTRGVQTRGRPGHQHNKEAVLMSLDYGRLGSLVGHEMTHAFDDSGHMYDESGQLGNGWLDMTEMKFWLRSQCFSRQYNYSIFLSSFDRTLGEDIADNGGVRRSYRAFKMAWKREQGNMATLPGLPAFTPDQLFFLGYATMWCYMGEEHAADVHSPHRDRANHPLSNMAEFSAAWNCSVDSAMNPRNKLCSTSLVVTVVVVAILDAPLDSKCVSRHCQTAARELVSSTELIINPCDDFYRYACGHFAERHVVPSGEVLWDYFKMLQDTMDNVSINILQGAVTGANPAAIVKAKNMYAACMDTELLEDLGLKPVVKFMEDWGSWPVIDPRWQSSPADWNYLADLIAEFAVQFLFSIQSLANLDNANTTALYIGTPNLGLPSPVVRLAEPPDLLRVVRSAEGTVESYPITQYLVKMAILLRDQLNTRVADDVIQKDIVEVILFMQELSQGAPGSESGMKPAGELDAWIGELLGNTTTRLKWVDFLQRALSKSGVRVTADTPVIISNPSAVAYIINLVETTDPRVFHNYVISRLLVFLSPESNREMQQAAFQFYVQQGYIPQNYPRWKYCLHKVMDYPYIGFSHAVAYEYRTTTFESRKLKEARQMVTDLISAFQELLAENKWMDSETRLKASEKVDAMYVLVGFPTWTDSAGQLDEFYQKMVVSRYDHFGNVARLRSFAQAINLATLGKPRDRNDWTQSPLVVNAFYNSLNNRITFPVGMMSDPFFSGNVHEKALDYGRIGAIVGHEITHGFDSVGRLHDNFGTAANWWSDVTEQRFSERAECFVDQYNNFTVMEINATVNGLTTLRENIADNGGVREAFRAFKRVQARMEPRLPGLEQYMPDQLFFLAYATMWCRAETLQGLEDMQEDSHSPNRLRVIGSLSNMNEFTDAFQCPLGSRMNPINKCVLW